MEYKALTVKQPWSFLICSGIKDIENRTWKLPEKYKGERVLIHASGDKRPDVRLRHLAGMLNQSQFDEINEKLDRSWPFMKVNTFAIIGSVRFTDCVINHPSIWAEETEVMRSVKLDEFLMPSGFEVQEGKPIYNWVATDAVLFPKPILNVKGKLGFWDYDLPEEYEKLLKQ